MNQLVVTKSLFGYVSNQVQYNMESSQYLLWCDYINKYISNSWNIVCDPGFHGPFYKTTIIGQLRTDECVEIYLEKEIPDVKKRKIFSVKKYKIASTDPPRSRSEYGTENEFICQNINVREFKNIKSSLKHRRIST